MKQLLLFISLVFIVNISYSQKSKSFQGTLTYNVVYNGEGISSEMRAQLPTTSVATIKDCKIRNEMVLGPMTQITISDGTAKTGLLLLNVMGSKYAIKMSAAQIAEQMMELPSPKVKLTDVSKQISGYKCKQAIISTTQEDNSVTTDTAYYCEDIVCESINFSSQYKEIPGMLFEYSEFNPQLNATSVYTIKEIKKEKISDDLFVIPADYKETTMDELKTMFGGQ